MQLKAVELLPQHAAHVMPCCRSCFFGPDCRDPNLPGELTQEYATGGMTNFSATIAVSPPNSKPQNGYVSVRPLLNGGCERAYDNSYIRDFNASFTAGSWTIYEIVYNLGPWPEFDCQLPPFANLTFWVPKGYKIRIAALRISGDGAPPDGQLQQIDNFQATPPKDTILSNMLIVYIAVAVGSLIILFLLLLLWYCCGKPLCCCGNRNVRTLCNAICTW